MKTFNLTVKLFHKDGHQAVSAAERIADAVSSARSIIPLIDPNGVETGEYLRISKVEVRDSDDFATIIVNWDSRYYYDREAWPALESVTFLN